MYRSLFKARVQMLRCLSLYGFKSQVMAKILVKPGEYRDIRDFMSSKDHNDKIAETLAESVAEPVAEDALATATGHHLATCS